MSKNSNSEISSRSNDQMDVITKASRPTKINHLPPKSDRELRSHKRNSTSTLLHSHAGLSTIESIYTNLKTSSSLPPTPTPTLSLSLLQNSERLTYIKDFINLLTEKELFLVRTELDRRQIESQDPPFRIAKEILTIIMRKLMRSNSNGWKEYIRFMQIFGIRIKELEDLLFLRYQKLHITPSFNFPTILQRHLQTRRAWNALIDDSNRMTDRRMSFPYKSYTLNAHNTSVITSLQLDPLNNQIYSASDDGTVAIWSLAEGGCQTSPLCIMNGPNTGGIWALKASPRKLFIVVGSTDRTLVVWGRGKGKEFFSQLIGHTSTVRCVDILLDRWIISGGRDGTIRIWDYDEIERDSLRKGHSSHLLIPCLWTLTGHTASVRCLGILERNSSESDGGIDPTPLLISGSYDGTLRVWDMGQVKNEGGGKPTLHSVLEGHDGKIYSVVTCKRFSLIVSGGLDGKIKCWRLSKHGSIISLLQSISTHNALVGILTIKGRLLSAGSTDGSISMWKVGRDGLVMLRYIDGAHKSSITALDCNLHILASGSERSIRLWSLERMLASTSTSSNTPSSEMRHQIDDDEDDIFMTQTSNINSSLFLPLSLKADVVWRICLGPPMDSINAVTNTKESSTWMERILVVAYQENGLSKIDLFHLLSA